MARIELVDLCKTLEESRTGFWERGKRSKFSISKLNLSVPQAGTMVVLGPSGCGKTTLLRLIAGLVEPDSGEVLYDGRSMKDAAPGQRRIGIIFQNYALYPHLDSKTNILSYFFFRKKTPALKAEEEAKFRRTSELLGVEIEHLLARKPPTLSGGEKQRVALGRCITRDPDLFLLDEPFSNLDPMLREKYRANLKTLLRQFKITTVYVTHDQQEALVLADLIAIMAEGRIEQVGTYEEIYNGPKNLFVAEFLKLDPLMPPISLVDGSSVPGAPADGLVGVRPEDVAVLTGPRPDGMKGRVIERTDLALKEKAFLKIALAECELAASIPRGLDLRPGQEVWVSFGKYQLFDKGSGLRVGSFPG